MADIGLVEYLNLGGDIAIIATFLLSLYFSLKEIKRLRVDLESKVLNDLNDQIHGMGEMLVERPELVKMLNKNVVNPSPELVFSFKILYMCAHAYRMRERKVLTDNEWEGWLRWMRTVFSQGEIGVQWKKSIEPQKWFDPAFQNFIDTEILAEAK